MIKVRIFEKDNKITGYEMSGHSGYAESGSDIICSAVSVLAINTANSLEQLVGCELDVSEKDGYLKVLLEEDSTQASELLLQSMILGLKGIQENNEKYLKVNFEEV